MAGACTKLLDSCTSLFPRRAKFLAQLKINFWGCTYSLPHKWPTKQLWKQSTTLQGSHDRPFPGTPQGKRRGEKQGERKNKENGGPGQRRRFRGEKKGRGNKKGVKERKRNGGREGPAIIRSFVTGATPSLCVCNTIWANCIALTLGTLLSVSEAFSNFPP